MTQVPGLHIAITGASSGLGAALARAYAKPGNRLTLAGRSEERLNSVASNCLAAGAEVCVVVCDVTDAPGMASWLGNANQARAIDLLIANAGVGGKLAIAPAQGEPCTVAHSILAANTLGVINTATPLLPRFVARGRGHLVFISSLAGLIGLPHSPVYCASKAAVRIYAEGIRRLMRPHNVHVTLVNPGFIDTPMARSLPTPGPQMWTAERAANVIKSAISQGKTEVSFPWSLRLAIGASRLIPQGIVDAVLAKSYMSSNVA